MFQVQDVGLPLRRWPFFRKQRAITVVAISDVTIPHYQVGTGLLGGLQAHKYLVVFAAGETIKLWVAKDANAYPGMLITDDLILKLEWLTDEIVLRVDRLKNEAWRSAR